MGAEAKLLETGQEATARIRVYPEGKMSQHFDSLKQGDTVQVKGPIEKLRYSPNMKKHIGMIAGGSGITPMLQIAEAILKNPDDKDFQLIKRKLNMIASVCQDVVLDL